MLSGAVHKNFSVIRDMAAPEQRRGFAHKLTRRMKFSVYFFVIA